MLIFSSANSVCSTKQKRFSMSGALGRVSFCLYNSLNNFSARVIKRLLIPQRQKFYCMGYLLILKYSSKCVSFCNNSKTLYYIELIFKRRFVIVRDIKSGNWGILPKKYYLMFPKFCRGVSGHVTLQINRADCFFIHTVKEKVVRNALI